MKLRISGYILFVVLCVCIATYRHFPSDVASKYIQHEISDFNSSLTLDIEGIKPSFPLGIKAEGISIFSHKIPVLGVEKFKIGCDFLSVFDDAVRCPFKCSTKDSGIISGAVHIKKGKKNSRIIIESELKNLKLNHISLGKFLYNLQVSGMVNGELVAVLDRQKLQTGHGNIKISSVAVNFNKAKFFVNKIFFSSVTILFNMPDPNTIKIDKCTMTGKKLTLESSGNIKIAPIFKNSPLNFKVNIHLYPMFFMENGNSSMPVKISKTNSDSTNLELTIGGTIQNPKIFRR